METRRQIKGERIEAKSGGYDTKITKTADISQKYGKKFAHVIFFA